MIGHDELADPPLPPGTSERRRWDYVYDNISDDMGGGFVSGTFMLRSDGAVLCVHGGKWFVDERLDPALTVEQVADHLRDRWYDLYEPGELDENGLAVAYQGTARG